jgi:transcriptional regulator with XRE-family HTH domain
MVEAKTLGERLKLIRKERNLSQRELAERAGISANAVSLIERDENSPSVATLQSLATALNIRISYFFEEDGDREVIFIRAGERPALATSGVRIEGLGGELPGQEIEPFVVSLPPGSDSGERVVGHSGHELVYCLSGSIEYNIRQEVYQLQPGDMLMFQAALPHRWRNPTGELASFLLILQTPGETAAPVQHHFSDFPSLTHLR